MNKLIMARLEYLRCELRAERISYGELAELQALAPHINANDAELLEAAGVPEFATSDDVKPIRVAVRRTRTKDRTPILFFYTASELTCYAHHGQHSAASLAYMHGCTRRADPTELDCAALLREWDSLGPDRIPFVVAKRLYIEVNS